MCSGDICSSSGMAKAVSADKLRLEPKKAYSTSGFSKFFWGGKSAVMAEKPELEPYDVDLLPMEYLR